MQGFGFTLLHQDKRTGARIGQIQTPHGVIETPAFVPVGTQATVKSLTPLELKELRVQLFFVNTYHMYLRPGMEVIKKFKGLHRFMGWNGPIITDSGGFQVFSLGRSKFAGKEGEDAPSLVKISEDGVDFRSHWDGSLLTLNPEISMDLQWALGSDMHIAFDDCTPYPVTYEGAKKSLVRTNRWAVRSLRAHQKLTMKNAKLNRTYQALYGVIQGSVYENLRKESAQFISSMDFDGIAIGGVSVGESKKEMVRVLDWVTPMLPTQKPRHLLGVGEIDDIFALTQHGMDTFDCVQPTRLARMGRLYSHDRVTKTHEIDISKKIFSQDMRPIEKRCNCYTCTNFSRGYLHHLFRVRELLGYRLATIHNIYFVHRLVEDIRGSIKEGTFLDLKKKWL